MEIIVSPKQYMALVDLARDTYGMQSEAASGTAWLDGVERILNDGTATGRRQARDVMHNIWPSEGHELEVDFSRK